jgi:hypothetical protein
MVFNNDYAPQEVIDEPDIFDKADEAYEQSKEEEI